MFGFVLEEQFTIQTLTSLFSAHCHHLSKRLVLTSGMENKELGIYAKPGPPGTAERVAASRHFAASGCGKGWPLTCKLTSTRNRIHMLTRSTKIVACFCVVIAGAGCRTSPQAKEAKYLQRGNALVASKDYARALLEFRNASSAMPKDAEPHYRMGMAYLETGDAPSAIRAFQRATALDPNHAAAQLKMAELMMTTRDPKLIEAAVARLEGTFGSTPNNPEVIDALAMGAWKLGKPEDALQHLNWVARKDPSLAQAQYDIGLVYLFSASVPGNTEEQAIDRAIEAFEKFEKLEPHAPRGAGDDAEELIARARNKKAILQAMKAQTAAPVEAPPAPGG